MSNPENDARVPLTRRQLRERAAAQEAARAAEEESARVAQEAASRAAATKAARAAEQPATRRARYAAPTGVSAPQAAPAVASGSHAAPTGASAPQVAPTGVSGSHAAPTRARSAYAPAQPTANPAAAPSRPQPSYLNTSALDAVAPSAPSPAPQVPSPAPQAPAPAPQAPSPVPPLSRKQLRERAAALRAEHEAQTAAPAQASQVAPAVKPPSVTGAIRALDETGQLTPVRPIASTGTPVPDRAPAEPTRVPVRDSLARAQSDAPARTYPQGTTPQPAAPARQPNPFSSPTSRTGSSAPSVSPVSPVAAGAPAAAAGPAAPVGPAALADPAWLPVNPAGSAAPAAPRASVASAPAAPTGGWAPTGAADDTVAVPAIDEEFEPPVPQWGAVRPVDPPREHAAGAADDAQDEDEEPSGWFGYTPLQYLLWVVIGLVLGVVIWQLIDRADDSPQGTGALTSVSSEYYQAAAPGP